VLHVCYFDNADHMLYPLLRHCLCELVLTVFICNDVVLDHTVPGMSLSMYKGPQDTTQASQVSLALLSLVKHMMLDACTTHLVCNFQCASYEHSVVVHNQHG
jgi:hypothetical protein